MKSSDLLALLQGYFDAAQNNGFGLPGAVDHLRAVTELIPDVEISQRVEVAQGLFDRFRKIEMQKVFASAART